MTMIGSPDMFGLTKRQRAAVRRAAQNSEYNLLLGAGASMESLSRTGRRLPGGNELATRIGVEFGVPVEEGDVLWRIYDRAIEKHGDKIVYSWLRKEFWGVTHPYWMEYYARSPWATVWTLNIDDTFESARRKVTTATGRGIESLNWDDPYYQTARLNVVHLHGLVDRPEPRRLVFSLSEYAESSSAHAAWPLNFHDSYGVSPYVILGARVRDEPDIEATISRRRPSHEAPSFYVAKEISAGMRTDLERWGLVPVEMTAEDFVLEWGEMTGLDLDRDLSSKVELGMRIGQQFTDLGGPPAPRKKRHDFLGGDRPTLEDIDMGLAAELQWIGEAERACGRIGDGLPNSIALIYTGRRLSGRSAGLLHIGNHLRKSAWRVFLYRGEGRLDNEAILRYSADGRSVALLFDGVASVAEDVDALVSEARKMGVSIACVAVDEASKLPSILGRVSRNNLAYQRVEEIGDRLTAGDAARLVDTLTRVGRLGILESKNDGHRLAHFRNKGIFYSMALLENAPGFGSRVGTLVRSLETEFEQEATLLAAYASYVGQRLPLQDASRMLGVKSDELVDAVRDELAPLSSVLEIVDTSLYCRHRSMPLEPLVKRMGPQAAAESIREGIRRVAPRLNLRSHRERNAVSLLVGAFMSHRNLSQAFKGADLDAWYASLLTVFGDWSGRYWEQRAIVARREAQSGANTLARAESFARRATTIVPDTYSFTTLGTVLLAKAANVQFDAQEYYAMGFEAFERAARLNFESTNTVSWLAFLNYATRVVRRVVGDVEARIEGADDLYAVVVADWQRIYAQVVLVSAAGKGLDRELERLRGEYDAALSLLGSATSS